MIYSCYLQTFNDRTTINDKMDNFKLGGNNMSTLLMERMKVENKRAKAESVEEGIVLFIIYLLHFFK